MKELSTKVFVIALIGTICFCLFIFIKQLIKEYKSRNSILNGYFVSADMFLKKWNERYKNETWNKSGCYVILIYSHAIKEFHKEKYEAIFTRKWKQKCISRLSKWETNLHSFRTLYAFVYEQNGERFNSIF